MALTVASLISVAPSGTESARDPPAARRPVLLGRQNRQRPDNYRCTACDIGDGIPRTMCQREVHQAWRPATKITMFAGVMSRCIPPDGASCHRRANATASPIKSSKGVA